MATNTEFTILANPGHGNGPSVSLLMAAEAIQEKSGYPVNLIFPDLADGRQRVVIQARRNMKRDLRIFFDVRLGELLRQVTLRDNNFRQNVLDIARYQASTQALAQAYIKHGLHDLIEFLSNGAELKSTRTFTDGDGTIELNHGSRIRLLQERAFYFFPCLLSDLLKHPEFTNDLDADVVARARARMESLEEGYTTIFLPQVHTFSWEKGWRPPGHAKVMYTPLPRPAGIVDTNDIPRRAGIYLMPSGVGNVGDHKVTEVAEAILGATAEELAIYYPVPPPKAFTERFPQGVILSARTIPHWNIQYVVGRAGWGTIWECVNAKKIFVAIPAIPGDDPEIALNLKTLRQHKLAVCWGDAQPIEEQVQEVIKAIDALLSGSKEVDGLKFMADRILELIGP